MYAKKCIQIVPLGPLAKKSGKNLEKSRQTNIFETRCWPPPQPIGRLPSFPSGFGSGPSGPLWELRNKAFCVKVLWGLAGRTVPSWHSCKSTKQEKSTQSNDVTSFCGWSSASTTAGATCLLAYLLTYLPTYLPIYLLTYLLTYPLTYLLTYLPTYLLTHSLTCLHKVKSFFAKITYCMHNSPQKFFFPRDFGVPKPLRIEIKIKSQGFVLVLTCCRGGTCGSCMILLVGCV